MYWRGEDWEYDGPAVVNFPIVGHVARKDHGNCQNCGKPIEAGMRYEVVPCVVDGEFKVYKQHNTYCWEAWADLTVDEWRQEMYERGR